jgi:nucleoside-diphosphate-sugar epimerase
VLPSLTTEHAPTGWQGQVGRAVLANLLRHNHSVTAFERSPDAWRSWEAEDGPVPDGVECVYGDIVDHAAVSAVVDRVDAVVHTAVFFPPSVNVNMPDYQTAGLQGGEDIDSEQVWLVNLKGLWNVLDAAQRSGVQRVVHLGSCHSVHADVPFFSAEVRRPDGALYAITKRLQEEMCRQFFDAHGLRTIVLRPDCIMDCELGIGRFKEALPGPFTGGDGWVDRHDLADAVRLAIVSETAPDFDVLHTVHTNADGAPPPDETCNTAHTREVLGWECRADPRRMAELRQNDRGTGNDNAAARL